MTVRRSVSSQILKLAEDLIYGHLQGVQYADLVRLVDALTTDILETVKEEKSI